jgi:acyl carrier protein
MSSKESNLQDSNKTLRDKLPKGLAYPAKYEDDYNSLTGKGKDAVINSPFLARTNRDIFLYSMALGFFNHRRVPLLNPRDNVSSSALHEDGEWFLYCLAVAEKGSLDVLTDMGEVAKIAEEYANGGFTILKELIQSEALGDPDRRMESELRKILASILEEEEDDGKANLRDTGEYEIDENDSMEIIATLENKLRILVEDKLSKISNDWIKDRIPGPEVVMRWREIQTRCSRGDKLFKKGESESLINYSELGDLYSIIKWGKNWKECFEAVFKDLKVFESDMEQLLMIRPEKAHSRRLNQVQIAKLKAIGLHFLTLIEQS